LAPHEAVLISQRGVVDSESLGFVYGKKAGEAKLKEILSGIPIEEDLPVTAGLSS